jgi:hypothetical protein
MHCKTEIYWKRVNDYNLFADRISSITFTKIFKGLQIPEHCYESNHIQRRVHIIFDPNVSQDEASTILDQLGLSWNSLHSNENKQCVAHGEIFTRPNHTGDWILKGPCLDCYCQLIKKNQDVSKSFMLSFI